MLLVVYKNLQFFLNGHLFRKVAVICIFTPEINYLSTMFAYLAAPGAPASFNCANETREEIAISWTKPDMPNGIITGYTVTWVSKNSNGSEGFQANSIEGKIADLCKQFM